MIHTHRVDANAINLDARHYSAPPSCGAFCCLEYRKFFKTVTGARHRVCITPSRTRHSVERAREICIPVQVAQCTSCQALAAQIEFGTGFLAPETDAPNSALEAMSLGRDRKIPAIIREKWPQKRLFCVWARRREFPKTGWWRTQSDANRSPSAISLLAGKLAGNFEKLRLGHPVSAAKALT